jgi:Protein of unknown function (DUF1194)
MRIVYFIFVFCGLAFAQPKEKVDVALVLAVDISYSMDLDEQRLQREGYYEALLSSEVQKAVASGLHGRIAISYIEWAGVDQTRVVLGWRIIDGITSAQQFVRDLKAIPPLRARRTSISAGLEKSMEMLAALPYSAEKQVIDVSGDGANNDGKFVENVRDEVVRKGISINGLPIMVKAPNAGWMDIDNLDEYYSDCVIGGAGSFMIPIKTKDDFLTATKRKMILELSYVPPAYEVEPVIIKAQSRKKTDCLIGEKMRRQRWGE